MTREEKEKAKMYAEALEVMKEVIEEMEKLAGSGQASELPENWDDFDTYEKADWFSITVDRDDYDPHLYHAKALESPKWTADYVAESWGDYRPTAQAHHVEVKAVAHGGTITEEGVLYIYGKQAEEPIYGVDFKGSELQYIRPFSDPSEAVEWLNAEEYDSRDRELVIKPDEWTAYRIVDFLGGDGDAKDIQEEAEFLLSNLEQ